MPKRMFIVEDDTEIQDSITLALKELGFAYEVEKIPNGKVALEKLAKGDVPDIILLDLMMPQVSGYTLLEQMHQQGLHTACSIIVMSADVLTSHQMARLGVKAFLTKPFSVNDLQHVLETLP